MAAASISQLVQKHRPEFSKYEDLYKHFHENPELSNQEFQTAERIVEELEKISSDFDIRPKIGGTGICCLLHNGSGPTVLLRADIDGLPVEERTGLPYASKNKGKMHACGHDMHISCLLAAAELLVASRQSWSGTLLLAFQPAEERGTGAQAMIDDGMYDEKRHNVPKPDICIGGHVVPFRAGVVGTRRGVIASSADSMRVTLHGRGGHASMPHRLVDPVVMAASTIMKLQTIVSREVDPADHACVTVASVQAGDTENIVVDDAKISIDVRAMSQPVRDRVNAAIRRIVKAESLASNAVKEPTFVDTRNFPLTINTEEPTAKLEDVYAHHFGESEQAYSRNVDKLGGSEDFSILGTAIDRPTIFFMYGGTSHELWDKHKKAGTLQEGIPVNHSALFHPQIQPTMQVGTDAYASAALTWLLKEQQVNGH